jgi:hypothetical protein
MQPLIPPEVLERIHRRGMALSTMMARHVEKRIEEGHVRLKLLADAGLLPEPDSQEPERQTAPPPSGS